MSLNQLLSKALHTRVSIVSSKGTFVRDQDFSLVYLNSTNFICEGKDIGDGMFVYRQRLRPVQTLATTRNIVGVNARNKSQHAGSLDENTKASGTQIFTIPYTPLFAAHAPAQTLLDVLSKRTQHCWTTLR